MQAPASTGSDIGRIVKQGPRISLAEMTQVAELAKAAGGGLVAVDGDGDWCGTGRIRVKWPPKPGFNNLVEQLVQMRINFEVLVNGIPVPEEILINASRRIR
jgi:hypothetical protein